MDEPHHRVASAQALRRRANPGAPYRIWRQEHLFEEVEGGTRVRDRVEYAVAAPGFVERLFVRPDLERVFAYRQERLREIFDGSRDASAFNHRSISRSTGSG